MTLDMVPRNYKDFAWTHLVSNANLTYLHFIYGICDTPPANALTNVRSLALTIASFKLITSILDPRLLPQLRHFAFDGAEVAGLRNSKLDAMLPQLETLTVDFDLWSKPRAAFLHSAANKTLVNVLAGELADVTTPPVPATHVRFDPYLNQRGMFMKRAVPNLITFVRKPQCRLESIYLDSAFKPTLSSSPDTVQILNLILVRICCAHEIVVVFEKGLRGYLDPFISP